MNEIAQLADAERAALFTETANRRGLNARIIEKDFWVCWTLKRLFELPDEISRYLIFKGGTSLSKVYGVIERFSEDIDVAIDKIYLGFPDDLDLTNLSAKERDKTVAKLDESCREVVQNLLFNALLESFSQIIQTPDAGSGWQLTIDPADPYGQTLLFAYPREISPAPANPEYVKPIVRIELGARPENQPAEKHFVQPYAAEEFPKMFKDPKSEIAVLAIERTFWEKATILHDQYHRPDDYRTADRISRHYYDLYKLAEAGIAEKALKNLTLLESVVVNKKSFFYRAGARYEEALVGKLHLVPSEARIAALKRDYEKMNPMFFAAPSPFENIVERLTILEGEINREFI